MNIILDMLLASKVPALEDPFRLGVFCWVAALCDDTHRHVRDDKGHLVDLKPYQVAVRPLALSQRLHSTQQAVTGAIGTLAERMLLTVDKESGVKGVWVVDLTNSLHLLSGGEPVDIGAGVDIKQLLDDWHLHHEMVIGHKYVGQNFHNDRRLLIELAQAVGEEAVQRGMVAYFKDERIVEGTWGASILNYVRNFAKYNPNKASDQSLRRWK